MEEIGDRDRGEASLSCTRWLHPRHPLHTTVTTFSAHQAHMTFSEVELVIHILNTTKKQEHCYLDKRGCVWELMAQ